MFGGCRDVKKIEFGKLDFSLVTDFRWMFDHCRNLDKLDVSNFNTKNSKSFRGMFYWCEKLKLIEVSKFNSSKCESIHYMFSECHELTEIDMLNWDMSNLKYDGELDKINPIDYLFFCCYKLYKIKISGNLKIEEAEKEFNGYTFGRIPRSGDLILNKIVSCNIPLDGYLPQNWSRIKE